MKLTISGNSGSGKSTIGRSLAEKYNLKFYSMGDLRGKMALDRGMTIDQLNDLGKTQDWTDKEVDEYQKKLGEKEDDFVIDGRTSFHFISDSVKIFLKVDVDTSAKRIFDNQRADEEKKETVHEVKKMIQKREKNDNTRYKQYYNINPLNEANYDLVVDSTNKTPEEVLNEIVNYIENNTRRK